jgi:hypothetical protein
LVSYVTVMSPVCPNFETPDGSAMWFGNGHSRIIQLVIVSVALLNAWILDSCMVCDYLEISCHFLIPVASAKCI